MIKKYLILTILSTGRQILVNPQRCDYVTTNSFNETVIINKNEPDLVVTESFKHLKCELKNYLVLTNKEDYKKVLINPLRVDFINDSPTSNAVFINKGQPMLTVKESFEYVKKLLT